MTASYYAFHDAATGLFGYASARAPHQVRCAPSAVAPDAADVTFRVPRLSRREGAELLALARAAAARFGYARLAAIAEPHERAWYRRHGFAPDPSAPRAPLLFAPTGAARGAPRAT